ncbi:hypothetical protein [Streptomyces sp. S.PB5]|nr:hypothetical protein [Streptomyces sp. S.PB5]
MWRHVRRSTPVSGWPIWPPPAMEDIYGNGKSMSSLDETNGQINLILDQ